MSSIIDVSSGSVSTSGLVTAGRPLHGGVDRSDASHKCKAYPSLKKLAHRRHVEHLVDQEPPQLGGLSHQDLQPLRLGNRDPVVLRLPSIERTIRHPLLLAGIGALHAVDHMCRTCSCKMPMISSSVSRAFFIVCPLHARESNRRWRKNPVGVTTRLRQNAGTMVKNMTLGFS